MMELITILHGIACVLLVLIVLMQGSKSEGLSGLFGGGSTTLFGTGTPTFLVKVTTVLGIIFMLTSISLTILVSQRSPSVMEKSVMQEESASMEESVMQEEPAPADSDSDVP